MTRLRLNGVRACLNPLPKIIGTNRREYHLPDELVLMGLYGKRIDSVQPDKKVASYSINKKRKNVCDRVNV